MSDPIRIGIVGAGRIVRAEHVPRFRSIAGVELAGVANRDLDSSRRAAAELGLPRAYRDWRELLDDPAIDAVLIGAWPVLHGPVSVGALEAGKHVLTEARMAATADDARAMVTAARSRPDLVAMVVPASFSFWADRTIRRLIDAGIVGRIRHVQARWDASGPGDPGDFWRWQRSASGQNVMALGILAEAMTRWLGQPRSVTAATSPGPPTRPGPDGLVAADVPDHVAALVDYPDAVTAVIEMSARTNGVDHDRVAFHGTAGSILVDLTAQAIELVGQDGERAPVVIEPADRDEWTAEIDFVAAIRGERPVTRTDFETGLGYMAFLEAVERSAAGGCRVVIEGGAP